MPKPRLHRMDNYFPKNLNRFRLVTNHSSRGLLLLAPVMFFSKRPDALLADNRWFARIKFYWMGFTNNTHLRGILLRLKSKLKILSQTGEAMMDAMIDDIDEEHDHKTKLKEREWDAWTDVNYAGTGNMNGR